MKIVLAIDSFKGCLSSEEAETVAAEGIKTLFPHCYTVCIPIADGGEGMLNVVIKTTKGHYHNLDAHNPLMEVIKTEYGICGDEQTAVIEMATISGLPLIPKENQNPMLTTSYGTGELIKDALDKGFRKFIIGIGGSATNDAGMGMLQALGFHFLNKEGKTVGFGGKEMMNVATIDRTFIHPALKDAHFTVACDVRNPFCGIEGAAHVFARQKGADDAMIEELDKGMHSLAKVIYRVTGKDISNTPGAGAAGGMGGGLLAFLNAELKPGAELLLEATRFQEEISGADWIITGEGKVDRQTLQGKVPYSILKAAQAQNIPVIVIAGSIEDRQELNRAGFKGVFSIAPGPITLDKAMEPEFAKENIKRLVEQLWSVMH